MSSQLGFGEDLDPEVPPASASGFKTKITMNVDLVISRINEIAPQHVSEEVENVMDPPESVQRGVTELVEAASTKTKLCMMDPTWHP